MEDVSIVRATETTLANLADPEEKNGVFYSELRGIYSNKIFRNFSIKCVLEGQETYKIDGVEHLLKKGMLLIASKNPDGEVYFDGKSTTVGLCIDIKESTINEAIQSLDSSRNYDYDTGLENYKYPVFFDRVDHTANTLIGNTISSLAAAIHADPGNNIQPRDEWFLSLAEKIVLQELGFARCINEIKKLKISTKKELLRRLLIGKAYMDENYLSNPSIRDVAKNSMLSEFHFFRSFRQAFHITPYRYMMGKRLAFSNTLIKKGNMAISDIAETCGFPDYMTFTKAYKRNYQISPTVYKNLFLMDEHNPAN